MAKEEAAEILSVDGREVRVTNPDKPYFSRDVKLSKLDVVQYYLSVASRCIHTPCARTISIIPTSCASISIQYQASSGMTSVAWRSR